MRSAFVAAALGAGWAVAPLGAQVTRESDLAFGTVIAGTPSNVTPTDPSAARWRIHFTALAAAASFQLTLPTDLTRVGGGATMPTSFCSTCGIYRLNNSNPSGGTVFDPANAVSLGLINLGADVYVWLGGSVSPPLAQVPGAYTGTVVLTVSGVVL